MIMQSLPQVLRTAGIFLPVGDINLLFRKFDIDGEGSVTYQEFLTSLKVRGLLR